MLALFWCWDFNKNKKCKTNKSIQIKSKKKETIMREYEAIAFENKFGTRNIEERDPLVMHGYYNNLHLRVFEDLDDDVFYVTFANHQTSDEDEYLPSEYMTFNSLDEAYDYIEEAKERCGACDMRDFNISSVIANDLEQKHDSRNCEYDAWY